MTHRSIAEKDSGRGIGGGSSAASTSGAGSPERSASRAAGEPLKLLKTFDICGATRQHNRLAACRGSACLCDGQVRRERLPRDEEASAAHGSLHIGMQARQRLALRVVREVKVQHAHAAFASERVERAGEARPRRTRVHRLQRSSGGAHSNIVLQAEHAERDVRRCWRDEHVRERSVASQQACVHGSDSRLDRRRCAAKAHEMSRWRHRGALRALLHLTFLLSRVVRPLLRRRCNAARRARHQHAAHLRLGIALSAAQPPACCTQPLQRSAQRAGTGRVRVCQAEPAIDGRRHVSG